MNYEIRDESLGRRQTKTKSRSNSGWTFRWEMLTFEYASKCCKHEIRNLREMNIDGKSP